MLHHLSVFLLLICVLSTFSFLSESSVIANSSEVTTVSNSFDRHFASSSQLDSSSFFNEKVRHASNYQSHDMSKYTGGEHYDPYKQAPYQNIKASIHCAATDHLFVYFNGKTLGHVSDYSSHGHYDVNCGAGDVISFIAMSHEEWHGIICDISYGGNHYTTGMPQYKICPSELVPKEEEEVWKLRDHAMCGWDKTKTMPKPDNDHFSKTYPYSHGGKYVWSPRATSNGPVYMRFVIGGETGCSKPDHSPPPVEAPEQCVCREVMDSSPGDCYDFDEPRHYKYYGKEKKCTKRDCSPSFECIENGVNGVDGATICFKRFATITVKPVKPLSRRKCVQVKLHPPSVFYSPYGVV